jgi:predicted DNA-binding ribbon-helix-helix protein
MEFDKNLEEKAENQAFQKSDMPKHRQLIKMLTFRVVPAYYKEIEKVAQHKQMSVSKLIRSYIKEGMKRDNELSNQEDKDFRVE